MLRKKSCTKPWKMNFCSLCKEIKIFHAFSIFLNLMFYLNKTWFHYFAKYKLWNFAEIFLHSMICWCYLYFRISFFGIILHIFFCNQIDKPNFFAVFKAIYYPDFSFSTITKLLHTIRFWLVLQCSSGRKNEDNCVNVLHLILLGGWQLDMQNCPKP